MAQGETADREAELPGVPSSFSCPDCGGVLWELHDGELSRFRCRVGHAYSPQALDVAQTESIEAALWAALRALREKASLRHHMAERAERRGHGRTAERFAASERNILHQARQLEEVLGATATPEESGDEADVDTGMRGLSGR